MAITLFELASERLLRRANSDDVRFAIRRAALTAVIDAMAHVDDSFGELGQHFREHEHAYLELLQGRLHPASSAISSSSSCGRTYGVFYEVEPFLRALPEPEADRARRDLASMIAELRAAGLDRQLAKTRDLRHAVVAAAEAFTECDCADVVDRQSLGAVAAGDRMQTVR